MKQWEMDLCAAIFDSDLQECRKKSLQIVRSHDRFETPISQNKADQLFEHIVPNENLECLTFVQKTNYPSLPMLKLCIKMTIERNTISPIAWNWIAEELKRWLLNPSEIKCTVKPMRLMESAVAPSRESTMSYRCTRTLLPYLQQKEIDQLTLFARSSGHLRASRELLKHANLDAVEKISHTYYNPDDDDLQQVHQEIETERSKRTKSLLKKHITTSTETAKRKM